MDLLFVLNKGHVYYLWYENIGTKVYYLCYKWVYHLFIFVPYIGLLFVPYIGLIFVLYKGLIFVRNLLVISPPGEPEASERSRWLPSFLNKNDFSLSKENRKIPVLEITSPKVLSPYFLKMSIFWQIILHFVRKTFGSRILFFTSKIYTLSSLENLNQYINFNDYMNRDARTWVETWSIAQSPFPSFVTNTGPIESAVTVHTLARVLTGITMVTRGTFTRTGFILW